MRKRTKAREDALKILYAWEITKETLEECRCKFWANEKSEETAVIEFTDILIRGVEANLEKLDSVIQKYATNWRLDRMAVIDKNVLRIAAFELMFSRDIPPKVAINEAIDIAKKYGDKDSGKFVNGILDKISKEGPKEEKA